MFSRTTAEFGQPERSASFVSLQLCLKSVYHILNDVSNGAYQAIALPEQYFSIRK